MPDNGWFGADEATDLFILEEEEKEARPLSSPPGCKPSRPGCGCLGLVVILSGLVAALSDCA